MLQLRGREWPAVHYRVLDACKNEDLAKKKIHFDKTMTLNLDSLNAWMYVILIG